MIILPDYFDRFICAGGACQNTCCTGWRITVDEETYQFYQGVPGEFGDYLRANLVENGLGAVIRMTEEKRCPFLDEEGLCQIYRNCGEEHMGDICTVFPRTGVDFGNIKLLGLSLSCEQVLRLICEEEEPLVLCSEYEPGEVPVANEKLPATVFFMMWAVRYLQDTSVPFSVSIGVVLYMGVNSKAYLPEPEAGRIAVVLERVPDVSEQFAEIRNSFDGAEMYQKAENLVFYVIDTVCQVVNMSNLHDSGIVLWDDAVSDCTDEERRLYVRRCLGRKKENRTHMEYMQRLAAAFLLSHAQALKDGVSVELLFLERFVNFMVLAAVLPLAWQENVVQDKVYFERLARIGRMFEHSSLIHDYVYPVLRDYFHLEVMDYVIAFMVLFDLSAGMEE